MLYLVRDNEICYLVRDKKNDVVHKQGMLLSIGGKVEDGETLVETVKREAREEAGIIVKNPQLRGVIHFTDFGTEKHDWVSFLFTSDDFEGEPTAGNEGSFIWKNKAEISKINTYNQDKIYLELLLKYSFFVAEFRCEGHEMIDYSVLKAL